jgi:iron-sulfur cluster repair protein YtfE (RIC family)
MQAGQRYCDGLFELIEPLAFDAKWEEAGQALLAFCCGLERHLEREERVVLPLIEEAYGPAYEPTRTMRMEHAGMRALLTAVEGAGVRRDAQELSAVMQTLRSMMQQHSSRAEDVIYPLADALSGGRAGDLLQALESRPPVAARA